MVSVHRHRLPEHDLYKIHIINTKWFPIRDSVKAKATAENYTNYCQP